MRVRLRKLLKRLASDRVVLVLIILNIVINAFDFNFTAVCGWVMSLLIFRDYRNAKRNSTDWERVAKTVARWYVEKDRSGAKAEGVRLAPSYLKEYR